MGFKVGIPCLKLDRQNHFGNKSKHSGNARAVVCEALEERYSSDEDLNRDLTQQNEYFFDVGNEKFKSGNALCDEWEKRANEFKVIDKNGKQKNLRSDAGIGFALIIKPEKEFMDSLSLEEQEKFLDASDEVIEQILEKRGLVIDCGVRHKDEGNMHDHIFGYDPEYKLGKKLGLPLYHELNNEYPKRMRQLGYDIDALKGYDVEKVNEMTADELDDYKKRRRAERKAHGLSSAEKKAQMKADEIINQANNQLEAVNALRADLEAEIDKRVQEGIEDERKRLEARESDLKAREANISTLESLERRITALEDDLRVQKAIIQEKVPVIDKPVLKTASRGLEQKISSAKKAINKSKAIDEQENAQNDVQNEF